MPLTATELLVFAAASLLLVLTPGPNMVYCISRTLVQGRRAGMLSLGGVVLGFLVHLLAATAGLTALLLAVPLAFDAIRTAGAAYLLWMAWQAVRPGGSSPFAPRPLPPAGTAELVRNGFLTNLLNPKVAMFYLSFFPQFLHPERGGVLLQALSLGAVQITVSALVNALLVLGAARIAHGLAARPAWLAIQRYAMGAVLAALALRVATAQRS